MIAFYFILTKNETAEADLQHTLHSHLQKIYEAHSSLNKTDDRDPDWE